MRPETSRSNASATDGQSTTHTPTPRNDSIATLRHWTSRGTRGSVSEEVIERIYVEMDGHPTIFAQRIKPDPRKEGATISWRSVDAARSAIERRALARKAFNEVPKDFDELLALVPKGGQSTLTIDPRAEPAPISVEDRFPLPCAYRVADTDALDVARLQHPLPQPIVLIAGHEEDDEIVSEISRAQNLTVVRDDVAGGGFLIEGRMIIRRKTNAGFHACLDEGAERLMEEAEALGKSGLHRMMIVEGGFYARRHYVLNRLASTLSYLQHVHGIHMIASMNRKHTSYLIVQAIKHHLFGMFSAPKAPDPIDGGDADAARRRLCEMLRALPGMSETRLRAVLKNFPSIRSLASADEAALRGIPGIGPRAARRISLLLDDAL